MSNDSENTDLNKPVDTSNYYKSDREWAEFRRRQKAKRFWSIVIIICVIWGLISILRPVLRERRVERLREERLHSQPVVAEKNPAIGENDAEKVSLSPTPGPTAKPTPTPYRRSTGKSSGKSSSYNLGPDASGYYDPDDFYYDYYDDFVDFEDAEDYYYSHGGW